MKKQDDKAWLQGLLEKHDETRAALSSYNRAEETKKSDPTEGAWNVNAGLSGVNQGLKGWNPAFGFLTGSTKFGAGLMGASAALMAAPGVAWQKATGGDVKNAWGYDKAKASFAAAEEGVRAAELLQTDEAERVAQRQLAPDFQKRQGESAEMALGRSMGYTRPGEQATFQNMRKMSSEMAGTAIFPISGVEKAGASLFGKLAPVSQKIGAKLGGDAALKTASTVLPKLAARPGAVGATTRAAGWVAKQSLEGANMGAQFSGLTGNDPVEGAIGGALLQPGFALGGKALVGTYRGAKGVVKGATDMAMGVKTPAKPSAPGLDVQQTPAGRWAQSIAKVNPVDAEKFAKRHGSTMGDYMVSHDTLKSTVDETVLANYAKARASREKADAAMEAISGTFKHEDVNAMAKQVVDDAREASSSSTGRREAAKWQAVYDKAANEGLTMTELNALKRQYESTVKLKYGAEPNSAKMRDAIQVDSDVRNFQREAAEKAGFGNLAEINKETQAFRAIADAVGKKHLRQDSNNLVSLTDYLMFAAEPKLALVKILAKGLKLNERFHTAGAKFQNAIGRGPGKAVSPEVDMAAIGKQSAITEAKDLYAKLAREAKEAGEQAKQDALKGPLFQQGPTGPKAAQGARAQFRQGMGPSGEAADPRAALLSGLDRSGARGPAAQPRPGQTVTANEAPGFFGYQEAKVMGETPALTDPHQRAAAALLGNKPSLPLLTNGAPRLPDRAPAATAPVAPVAPEAPKLTFGKKAEPTTAAPAAPTAAAPTTKLSFGPKKTAEQLQSEIDAIGEQLGASHNPGAAAALRQKQAALQSELDKLVGKPSVAQGTVEAPKKTPTPEEQEKAAAFLGKGKPTTDQTTAAAKHKARMEELKAQREGAKKSGTEGEAYLKDAEASHAKSNQETADKLADLTFSPKLTGVDHDASDVVGAIEKFVGKLPEDKHDAAVAAAKKYQITTKSVEGKTTYSHDTIPPEKRVVAYREAMEAANPYVKPNVSKQQLGFGDLTSEQKAQEFRKGLGKEPAKAPETASPFTEKKSEDFLDKISKMTGEEKLSAVKTMYDDALSEHMLTEAAFGNDKAVYDYIAKRTGVTKAEADAWWANKPNVKKPDTPPEGGQSAPAAPEAPKAPQTPAATHLAEVLEGKPTTAPADTKAALGELKAKFDENAQAQKPSAAVVAKPEFQEVKDLIPDGALEPMDVYLTTPTNAKNVKDYAEFGARLEKSKAARQSIMASTYKLNKTQEQALADLKRLQAARAKMNHKNSTPEEHEIMNSLVSGAEKSYEFTVNKALGDTGVIGTRDGLNSPLKIVPGQKYRRKQVGWYETDGKRAYGILPDSHFSIYEKMNPTEGYLMRTIDGQLAYKKTNSSSGTAYLPRESETSAWVPVGPAPKAPKTTGVVKGEPKLAPPELHGVRHELNVGTKPQSVTTTRLTPLPVALANENVGKAYSALRGYEAEAKPLFEIRDAAIKELDEAKAKWVSDNAAFINRDSIGANQALSEHVKDINGKLDRAQEAIIEAQKRYGQQFDDLKIAKMEREEAMKKSRPTYVRVLEEKLGFKKGTVQAGFEEHAENTLEQLLHIVDVVGLDIQKFAKKYDINFKLGSTGSATTGGTFNPATRTITSRGAQSTTAHEVGHFFDYILGLEKSGKQYISGGSSLPKETTDAASKELVDMLIGEHNNSGHTPSDIFKRTVSQVKDANKFSTMAKLRKDLAYYTHPTEIFARGFETAFSKARKKYDAMGYQGVSEAEVETLTQKFLAALKPFSNR